jgi:two-component system, NarL family, sensor histidine kinase EvgS
MSVAYNNEPRELANSVAFLCKIRSFGYAVLDEDFRAIWRHGELASWIIPGENVCTSTELLFGLEHELLNLQDNDGACLALPRVGLPQTQNNTETLKISVEVFWDDYASRYHVVIHRLMGESEVELELLKQIRARRLAEQNFQTTREKLVEQQTLLDVLMKESPVALALFDKNMRYLFASRHWAEDFGLTCQPLIGRSHYEMCPSLPGDERNKHEACLAGGTTPMEVTALTGGEEASRWVRWSHRAWQRSDGATGGVLIAAEDLTAIMEARRALERANTQLRLATQQLTHFSSVIAHDFNAPLRSLETLVTDLASIPSTPEGKCAIISLFDHVERMKSMLKGLADYCQMVSACASITPGSARVAKTNIRELVTAIVATHPKRRAFTINIHAPIPEAPVHITLLDLVLRNLIDNAMKHHDRDRGHIEISLSQEADTWLLSVTDDGPGIAPAHHHAIFEPFARLIATTATGQGMGLPIVKRTLDGVGATIEVTSEPILKRGTTFVVRWPKTAPTDSP